MPFIQYEGGEDSIRIPLSVTVARRDWTDEEMLKLLQADE